MLAALVIVATTLLSAIDVRPAPPAAPAFHLIVNRANPVVSMTRADVSAIFMKKVRTWPDGTELLPVDQVVTSRARDAFSRSVHGKSVAFVLRYWHRLIFSGRGIPPVEAPSDEAVIEIVKAQRGAIGYINASTPLPADVKVITVTK